MRKPSPTEYHAGPLRRYLVFLVLVPLGYLLHVCVMPYIRPFGISPNLLFAVIAIVTVAYGRLQAFWVGLFYGLCMEVMLPSVTFLNLGLYAVLSLFAAFVFADKSARAIEMERAMKKPRKGLPAWLRTLLCAVSCVFAYEVVQIAYIYLGGSVLTVDHYLRGVGDVLLTGLMTFLLEFPVRRLIFGRPHKMRTRPDPVG